LAAVTCVRAVRLTVGVAVLVVVDVSVAGAVASGAGASGSVAGAAGAVVAGAGSVGTGCASWARTGVEESAKAAAIAGRALVRA